MLLSFFHARATRPRKFQPRRCLLLGHKRLSGRSCHAARQHVPAHQRDSLRGRLAYVGARFAEPLHVSIASQHGLGNRGGLCGGAALAIFYRALAIGKMGLAAPLTAVIAAVIPTLFGMITEGVPSKPQMAGFILAGISIWLISRSEDHTRPEGLGLAVLAAIGFAGFFLCAKQAGQGSALWMAAISRGASLLLTAAIVFLGRQPREINLRSAVLGSIAGFLDSSGTALFIRASQTGRLDAAVVISSLYPAITVLLARFVLHEHLSRWKLVGMVAALAAVALIAV